jgi:hypothetical protein
MAANIEIIHAYRHLYRNFLNAVKHSHPGSTIVRRQLRLAFREKGATFDPSVVKRTVWFAKCAATDASLEHKILKNLVRMHAEKYGKQRYWKTFLFNERSTEK